MEKSTDLQNDFAAFVEREAKKRSKRGAATDELLSAQLEVLTDVQALARTAESESVLQLRDHGLGWVEIGDLLGISDRAAFRRYGVTPNTTPESRNEQSKKAQPRVTPEDIPGISAAEAQSRTGIYSSTIYQYAKKDPEAKWFVRIETAGKRGSVLRVVDVDGLVEAQKRRGKPAITDTP